MIFKRSYKIPLYTGRLYIILCESLKEAQENLSLEFETYGPLDDYDGGCFQRENKHYIILEHNPEPGVIAHECKHFVNHVFATCGIELDRFNDEAECYLLGWAVDKVYETIEKHKKDQGLITSTSIEKVGGKFSLVISKGSQSFRLAGQETKEEAEWTQEMFNKAFKEDAL